MLQSASLNLKVLMSKNKIETQSTRSNSKYCSAFHHRNSSTKKKGSSDSDSVENWTISSISKFNDTMSQSNKNFTTKKCIEKGNKLDKLYYGISSSKNLNANKKVVISSVLSNTRKKSLGDKIVEEPKTILKRSPSPIYKNNKKMFADSPPSKTSNELSVYSRSPMRTSLSPMTHYLHNGDICYGIKNENGYFDFGGLYFFHRNNEESDGIYYFGNFRDGFKHGYGIFATKNGY